MISPLRFSPSSEQLGLAELCELSMLRALADACGLTVLEARRAVKLEAHRRTPRQEEFLERLEERGLVLAVRARVMPCPRGRHQGEARQDDELERPPSSRARVYWEARASRWVEMWPWYLPTHTSLYPAGTELPCPKDGKVYLLDRLDGALVLTASLELRPHPKFPKGEVLTLQEVPRGRT